VGGEHAGPDGQRRGEAVHEGDPDDVGELGAGGSADLSSDLEPRGGRLGDGLGRVGWLVG
jgi:hypothetical protein